jgi:murein L,D-transpeptidase YafK
VFHAINFKRLVAIALGGWFFSAAAGPVNPEQPRIAQYEQIARSRLLPFFQQAGVQFPPKQLALLIFKENQRLDLWAKDAGHKGWTQIRSFSVLAASGSSGPKLYEGDRQVPEGIYHITHLNPFSHFDLSMGLDYPNAFDRIRAKQDGRNRLGGDIFIHGGNQSIGCIAIGDAAIEQLFPLVAMVGVKQVQVIIAPNDYRRHTPEMASVHPGWVASLYQTLDQALQQFS